MDDYGGGGAFDFLTAGLPGYSGLTPDQAAMVNQTGYFMRPDAVQPNGQPWQQPTGYSGLTPDQIQAVNQQGFYTGTPGNPSIWQKLQQSLGSGGDPAAQFKQAQQMMAPPQPRTNLAPAVVPPTGSWLMNPNFNIYRRPQLNPAKALGLLQGAG